MEWPAQIHKHLGQLKTTPPTRRRKLVFVLGGLVFAYGAWHVGRGLWEGHKPDDLHVVPVTQAVVTAKPTPVQIVTIGHVEPMISVAIRPRVQGQIQSVAIADGQSVKAGDVLFQLDDRQARAAVDQAQATLSRDAAQRDFAVKEAERQQKLVKNDFVSRSQLDEAKATAAAAEATVALDRALLANAQAALSFTVIQAPIDGRAGGVAIKTGNTVDTASTTPLVTINQMAPIYVTFSVPQREFPDLRKALGEGAVAVTAKPTGDDGAPPQGTLAFIENAIDPATGTLGVKASFPNTDERLWPGQFVEVVVTLRTEPNALTVPSTAVQMGQSGNYVFIIKPDQTVELRAVTVDRTIGLDTVIATGLKAGETVVTSGQLRLVPGAKIRVRQDEPAGKAKDKPQASTIEATIDPRG